MRAVCKLYVARSHCTYMLSSRVSLLCDSACAGMLCLLVSTLTIVVEIFVYLSAG